MVKTKTSLILIAGIFLFCLTPISFQKLFASCQNFPNIASPPPGPCPNCPPKPGGGPPSPNPYATASPFYVRSGNYVTSATDVSIPTRGFRLTVWRFYDSARYVDGPFGFGWGSNLTTHLSYTTYIDPVAGSQKIASVVLGDGTTYDFLELSNGTNYVPYPTGKHYFGLVRNGDGSWDFTWANTNSKYRFAYNATTHDHDGAIESMKDDYGNAIVFVYSGGMLSYIKDVAAGGSESGRRLNIGYVNGRISTITDTASPPRTWSYIYNANGTLASVQTPLSNQKMTVYSYDTSSDRRYGPLLTQIKTSIPGSYSGVITDIAYHPLNVRNKPYCLGDLDDCWNGTQYDRVFTYTENGQLYKILASGYKATATDKMIVNPADPSQNLTATYSFNSDGYITQKQDYTTEDYSFYNTAGKMIRNVSRLGVDWNGNRYRDETCYTYNADGTLASLMRGNQSIDPATFVPSPTCFGSFSPLAIKFVYEYDPSFPGQNKVIRMTAVNPANGVRNADWQSWAYDYYQPGSTAPGALYHVYRAHSDAAPTSCSPISTQCDILATYTYNQFGQVLTVIDATGDLTTYSYDPTTGDLLSVTYPQNSLSGPNPTYQYGHDAVGRVTSVTDPSNHITSYTYDEMDRIKSVTLPKPSVGSNLDFTTHYDYDIFDVATNLLFTHQTDPNGRITKQGYDQFGRLVRSIDAQGGVTIFAYATTTTLDLPAGKLASITDANNNVTRYFYDQALDLKKIQFPDGTTEQYYTDFYGDHLPMHKIDRKGQTTSLYYDSLRRVIQKNVGNAILYNYTGQKLTNVQNNNTNPQEYTIYGYDTSYRMQKEVQGATSLGDNVGRGRVEYAFDAADRPASYSINGTQQASYTRFADGSLKTINWAPVGGQFTFDYKPNGQYSQITMPDGQHRDYTYDDQGRLLQIANIHPSAGNLGTFSYGYDNPLLGQRSSMTSALGTTSYSYDSNYHLTGASYPTAVPFNGEVHAWTYDNIGNRLTNIVNASTANYTYYKNGTNSLNGQRLQSDGLKTYTYDANGNLIGDGTYTYSWDYENRLMGITGGGLTASYSYDDLGRRKSKTVNGITTNYLYDGQNLVREMSTTTADYVFGPDIDQPLAQNRNNIISYYSVDAVGSTTVLNDPFGAVQDSYIYDAWGVIRNQTGSTANSFGYTSREFAETGAYFYRARYYSPGIGRFTSEDPLRYSVSFNPFNYGEGNPIRNIDPLGLVCWECTYDVKSGGEIVGGAFVKLHCVSDCVGKRRIVADVKARVIGASVGFPPVTFSQSSINLCDTYPVPYAKHLEGDFNYGCLGGGIGPIGGSCTKIKLGEAESKTVCSRNNKSFGVSADSLFHGSSKVETSKEEECCENSECD